MSINSGQKEGDWTCVNRIRNKNNLLQIGYNPRFPNLKVLKKCRSHLAVMGIPGSKGEHFLWPEEAVYLVESCVAQIIRNDIPMTLQESFLILQEKHVPFYKYITYSLLKKNGFVVVRPRSPENLKLKKSEVLSEKEIGNAKNMTKDKTEMLLKCFPSLDNGSLHMPQLHKVNKLVPAECQTMLDLNFLQVSKIGHAKKSCRPTYWPSLASASTSSTWAEYSARKKEILEKRIKSNKRKEPGESLSIDFEVYRTQFYSYTVRTEPIFRVKCFSSRESFNYSNLLPDLADETVIFSIFEQGLVGFINSSGNSINITHL